MIICLKKKEEQGLGFIPKSGESWTRETEDLLRRQFKKKTWNELRIERRLPKNLMMRFQEEENLYLWMGSKNSQTQFRLKISPSLTEIWKRKELLTEVFFLSYFFLFTFFFFWTGLLQTIDMPRCKRCEFFFFFFFWWNWMQSLSRFNIKLLSHQYSYIQIKE